MDSCRTISFAKSRMRESRTSGSVEGLALQGASLLDKLEPVRIAEGRTDKGLEDLNRNVEFRTHWVNRIAACGIMEPTQNGG